MSVKVKKVATRVSFVLAIAALLAPVTVASDGGIIENDACADGACCPEFASICGVEDPYLDHYSSPTGRCKRLET